MIDGRSTFFAISFAATFVALSSAQPPTTRTQWDGVYSDEQAARGRSAYARYCASCHGVDLGGVPQPVRFPGASPRTPALVGDEFIKGWSDLPLRDLLERTRISMPQENPGSLPKTVVADILAFVLQFSGYPSGSADLPSDAEELSAIVIRWLRR